MVKILVKENVWVKNGTDIAYLESTADHNQVLLILKSLKELKEGYLEFDSLDGILLPRELELGELQNGYQNLYSSYLEYRAMTNLGISRKRREYILEEIDNLRQQGIWLKTTLDLQRRELVLGEAEFELYRGLEREKVISALDLQQREAVLLAKRQIIPQSESSIINNNLAILSKSRELSELENGILEEKKRFVQSMNSFISEAESWKKLYVLTSSTNGYLVYSSSLQELQHVAANEVLFYVNPGRYNYHGEMYISPAAMSKVMKNQEVLIKVRSYPYQQYGFLRGRIDQVGDIPTRDSLYFSKVTIFRESKDSLIKLKPGMMADAEIITLDVSVAKRIWLDVGKSLNFLK
ncbi:hypothetical protein GCM10023091_00440 [Ravibacter arvi]|uniref:AprE-like beta-barrel domain-containing protein n=1 Tax=Ravibacter arvi TaxID=2051041 RepID=A0ABP8LL09_9BACT